MTFFRTLFGSGNAGVSNRARTVFEIGLIVLILAFLCIRFSDLWGYVASPNLLDDDLRQHMLGVYAKKFPEQFRDGFLARYSSAYLPLGYKALFYSMCRFVDPILLSKILGIVLLAATFGFAYGLGREVGGRIGGLGLLLLILNSRFILSQTYAGLYRGFAFPITLAFLWAWYRGKIWGVALSVILMALFYPQLSLVLWTAYSVARMLPLLRKIRLNIRPIAIWSAATLCMVVILLQMVHKEDFMGPVVDLRMARSMPEWLITGRIKDLPLPAHGQALMQSVRNTVLGVHVSAAKKSRLDTKEVLLLLGFLVLMLVSIRNRRAFLPGMALALSGVGWYLVACRKAYALGYPDRYLDYSLLVSIMLLWPLAWSAAGSSRWSKYIRVFVGVVLVGTILFVRPGPSYLRDSAYDSSEYKEFLDYLGKQDKPMLIAGWPDRAVEYIPMVAHKEVLVDYEHAHPLYLDYYDEVRRRLIDVVRLTFATNVQEAASIRERYGLTHLLVEDSFYNMRKDSPCIFAPYNGLVVACRRGPEEGEHIFANPPQDWIQYQDDKQILIDLCGLPAATNKPPIKAHEALAIWHQTIRLTSLKVGQVKDSTISLEFGWQVSRVVNPRRWSVFVHFIHEDSGFQFCGDHKLLEKFSSEDICTQASGAVFRVEREVFVPDDAPPGKYRIELGVIGGKGRRRDRLFRTDLPDFGETVYKSDVTIEL